jgi:hypothetical protein
MTIENNDEITNENVSDVPPAQFAQGYGSGEDHPKAVLVFTLSLVGLFLCQLISPITWVMASKARKEVGESPGRFRDNGLLTAGWVLSIVGTAMLAFVAFFFLFFFAVFGFTLLQETSSQAPCDYRYNYHSSFSGNQEAFRANDNCEYPNSGNFRDHYKAVPPVAPAENSSEAE